jgi:hypothetical protein
MNETSQKGWIGVDLDGTLAYHDSQQGLHPIGKPNESILFRVQQWLEAGIEVRIFTARAAESTLVLPVKEWLRKVGLPDLAVTHRRDFNLLQIWDDRAIQLETNTAELLTPRHHLNLTVNGWMGVELDGVLAHYENSQSLDKIGEPIPKMLQRVQQWLMTGMDVRLFTARASDPRQIPLMKRWLETYKLQEMKITCEKDFAMSQFWDDRSVHVVSNTGEVVGRLNQFQPERKYPAI